MKQNPYKIVNSHFKNQNSPKITKNSFFEKSSEFDDLIPIKRDFDDYGEEDEEMAEEEELEMMEEVQEEEPGAPKPVIPKNYFLDSHCHNNFSDQNNSSNFFSDPNSTVILPELFKKIIEYLVFAQMLSEEKNIQGDGNSYVDGTTILGGEFLNYITEVQMLDNQQR